MKKEIKNIPAPAPLLCWDIFMEGYHKKLESVGDLQLLNKMCATKKWQCDWDFETQLLQLNKTIIVTDPSLQIAYASNNVFDMNGYCPDEIIGKKSGMFQGKDTSADTKTMIRNAINTCMPFEATILNYRRNGESYFCHIEAFPVFNQKKALVNFIAFENIA